jgi:hypothetical protein
LRARSRVQLVVCEGWRREGKQGGTRIRRERQRKGGREGGGREREGELRKGRKSVPRESMRSAGNTHRMVTGPKQNIVIVIPREGAGSA